MIRELRKAEAEDTGKRSLTSKSGVDAQPKVQEMSLGRRSRERPGSRRYR